MGRMRSEEEIVDFFLRRYKEWGGFSLFYEFEGKLLIPYLGYEALKRIAKETDLFDINKIEELKDTLKGEDIDKEKIINEMVDYLEFAYDKACGMRGISAQRSIHHYIVWFWLIEDPFWEIIDKVFDCCYSNYGIPILNMIVEHLNKKYKRNIDLDKLWWCKE